MFTRSYYFFWVLFWNRSIKLSQYNNFYEWLLQLWEISTRPNWISDWKSWRYEGNFRLVITSHQRAHNSSFLLL